MNSPQRRHEVRPRGLGGPTIPFGFAVQCEATEDGRPAPVNEPWGARTFGLQDPSGNTLFVIGPAVEHDRGGWAAPRRVILVLQVSSVCGCADGVRCGRTGPRIGRIGPAASAGSTGTGRDSGGSHRLVEHAKALPERTAWRSIRGENSEKSIPPHASIHMPASSFRSLRGAVLVAALPLLAACPGGGDAPDPSPRDGAQPQAASPLPASASPMTPGRWSGEATGGYTGNRISFTVSADGARMEDITFEGHWDCADGIETATLGPAAAFPLSGDTISVLSVEPENGGATAQRFDMQGRVAEGRASGTVRINLNALGCDTRVLRWTAAPAS
jgi:hypothetical protein